MTDARLLLGGGAGRGLRRVRQSERLLTGKHWVEASFVEVRAALEDELCDEDETWAMQASNLFRKFTREYSAGTGERESRGRASVCLNPEAELLAGASSALERHG